MKKLILSVIIAIFSLTAFAQINYAVSVEYQTKLPTEEWTSQWEKVNSPVLIYLDMGFGFIAVENGYKDRFIIVEMDKLSEDRYKMKCTDKDKKQCTLETIFFESGNIALVIMYNDIHYAYLINSEATIDGYPFLYFEDEENSNSKITPSNMKSL